jgi:hypothetical protein
MRKALILLLAFVMVISAGMGFGAAATPSTNGSEVQGDSLNDTVTNVTDPGDNSTLDPTKNNSQKDKITIVIIQKKIYYIISGKYYFKGLLIGAGGAGGNGGAGRNGGANNGAGGKSVPMQKTGLPILPGILSTLMVGSGLLYSRLRN